MKVRRTIETETDNFIVGDVISFELENGEKCEAMAMQETDKGMLFMLVDCLADEYAMNEEASNRGGYDASDMRGKLNEEILERFPLVLREHMIAFDNGDFLRLPTEKEIFGDNECGEEEPDTVEQFEPIKERHNRISLKGHDGEPDCYWLTNRSRGTKKCFVYSNRFGSHTDRSSASYSFCVRPVFLLTNFTF